MVWLCMFRFHASLYLQNCQKEENVTVRSYHVTSAFQSESILCRKCLKGLHKTFWDTIKMYKNNTTFWSARAGRVKKNSFNGVIPFNQSYSIQYKWLWVCYPPFSFICSMGLYTSCFVTNCSCSVCSHNFKEDTSHVI